jgi:hypothetical protein
VHLIGRRRSRGTRCQARDCAGDPARSSRLASASRCGAGARTGQRRHSALPASPALALRSHAGVGSRTVARPTVRVPPPTTVRVS